MRVGLYGGSFDPIHIGHLILAREAMERLGLDRIRFIPVNHSPHKPEVVISPGALRLEMIQAAVAGEPGFEVDDIELRRPPPSYTIDTVRSLVAAEPGVQFDYFVGADNLPLLPTWREFEALRRTVRLVVLARGNESPALPEPDMPVIRRQIEISSTEIRNRIASGRSIRYLVPDEVAAIIRRESLYRSPPSTPNR